MLAGRNLWLMKPPDLFAGMGIRISDNIKEIENLVNFYKSGIEKVNVKDAEKKKKYRNSTVLLQKYLEKPLLYRGRKFDMRVWVLVDHKMKGYMFKRGHFKASSRQFNLFDNDQFTHITNFSVQKHDEDFQKYEAGNEISYDEFTVFL